MLTPNHTNRNSQRGFALIVSLGLLAFIVLLLLVLGNLVSIESSQASSVRTETRAREHALLGLQVAMGQLQAATGIDRVSTGPVNVDSSLAVDDSKKNWTGVWENRGVFDPVANVQEYDPSLITVLVSGDPTADSLASPSAGVRILGEGTVNEPNDYVEVPLEPLGGATPTGNFAYWVSDESTKARVNLIDRYDAQAGSRVPLVSSQRNGLELMDLQSDPGKFMGDDYPANDGRLEKVLFLDQFAQTVASGSVFEALNRSRYHDLTAMSRSILTDARRGGLKRDLTQMLRNDSLPTGYLYQSESSVLSRTSVPGPAWSLIQDFYDLSNSLSPNLLEMSPREGKKDQADSSNHFGPIGPSLTQVKLYFDFSFSTDGHLRMHMFPAVVLHNPYNVSLTEANYLFSFPQHNEQSATELEVDIQMDDGSSRTFGGYHFKEPNPIFLEGANSGEIYFTARNLSFGPGEVKVLTLGSTAPYQGPVNTALVTTENPDRNSYQSNQLEEGFSDLNSAFIEFQDSLAAGEVPEFYSFSLVNGGSLRFRTELLGVVGSNFLSFYDGVGYNQFSLGGTSAPIQQDDNASVFPVAGFSYKMDLGSVRQLASFNYHSDHISQNGYETEHSNLAPRLFVGDFGQGDFSVDGPAGSPANAYFGPSHGSDGFTRVVFFEIPPNDPGLISLGQLQHLDLSTKLMSPGQVYDRSTHNSPTYAFGNSLALPTVPRESHFYDGGTSNFHSLRTYFDTSYRSNEALWDGYFFSTAPETVGPLVNRRFTIRNSSVDMNADPFASAGNLYLEGGFNVNSTSESAWRAVLAGIRDYDLRKQDGSLQGSVDNLFSRFTLPMGNAMADPLESDVDAWQGVRRLSDGDIGILAAEIVREVRARGPFLSVAEFINRRLVDENHPSADLGLSGALQSAINASGLNHNVRGSPVTAAPPETSFPAPEHFYGYGSDFAPGFLSQGDLVTSLGPVLTTRGDTFLIRSYGNALNSVDSHQIDAEVLLEAIVQRVPEKLDPTEAIESGDTGSEFGRRYKLVSYRWLDNP
ncbi:hypothetical protein [Puniceicoccus vermicola]|uniref:Verru_Chthon cassette protein A n=1 Tax=Puniceicoccus vermicola TaxID=388746 RepID=A0A7X1AZ36_9BACT|nr:hypothetical protein [Puniceicoccus vermicola]MBC2602626.1 hypothetical protein [Puniceicoccus vermicola]